MEVSGEPSESERMRGSASPMKTRAELQVFGSNAGVLCNTGKHSGADFLAIAKGEDNVGPTFAEQGTVRTRLPLDLPSDAKLRGKQEGAVVPDGTMSRT